MSQDDEDRFRPRLGRIRSDARGGAATKSFFTRVRKIARQHGAGPPGASAHRTSGGSGGRARSKVGVRRGRGAAFVRGRTLGERGWSHRKPGARRVIVKSRSVRAAGKNGRAAAHLRYIQRDGTSRDGERGRLYSATQDRTDGDAFLDRGKDDRHQFRVIVSPEDGMSLADLSGSTRDLIFPIAELLRYITAAMTLEPGDLIPTGTPAGVGAVQADDRIQVEIDSLGVLENQFAAS